MDKKSALDSFFKDFKYVHGISGEITEKKIRDGYVVDETEHDNSKLSSKDFLNFATKDFHNLSEGKARVDCLTNCKRALISKIDELIELIGFNKLSVKKGWSTKAKLDFLTNCGLITPSFINRINSLRNKLEHEFYSPNKNEAIQAYESTALFMGYANSITSLQLPRFSLSIHNGIGISIQDGGLHFKIYDESSEETVSRIYHHEPEFKEILNFFIIYSKASSTIKNNF